MVVTKQGEAFLFYFERWRGSRPVQRMSFAERGVFLEMLIEQWIRGDLPDNPQAVADAIASSDVQVGELETAWPAVRRQFCPVPAQSTRIQNLPLEKIRKERRAWIRQRKLAASTRWSKNDGTAGAVQPDTERSASALRPHRKGIGSGKGKGVGRDLGSGKEKELEGKGSEIARAPDPPRPHQATVLDGALPRDHRDHVFCDPRFAFCVPAAVHAKFIDPLTRVHGGDRQAAHTALKAWYAEVTQTLPDDFVMGDAFKFWQPRFDQKFASKSSISLVSKVTERNIAGDEDAIRLVQENEAQRARRR